MPHSAQWDFWIDRGGTFTDVIAQSPDGRLHVKKLLSQDAHHYEDAVIAGIAGFLGAPPDGPLPHGMIGRVKLGTTIATNALLERKGAPTVFVTTEGHKDALLIGTQHRPKIFALNIEKPDIPHAAIIEASERLDADGRILTPLDAAHLRTALADAFERGIRSAAICFLHGYKNPVHESAAAALAREAGFTHVSVSHLVSPLMKFVPRALTTLADAYLTPILRAETDRLASRLGTGAKLYFMTSGGGLALQRGFQGKDAVLSGPAGGVVGAVETARADGFEKIIAFDMGGTSTDVSHFDGIYERAAEAEVAGLKIRTPMMAIHTVAAGGGSLLRFQDGRLRVGPHSAGANPGPLSYGRGGPLTVTDANLMTGRISAAHFPTSFGPGADAPLDEDGTRSAFDAAAAEAGFPCAEALADAYLEIAADNMARAIKTISIEKGHDLAGYVLACFGGAGGQLAARVADAIGITRIHVHPFASLLSAYGIGLAPLRSIRERMIEMPLGAPALKTIDEGFAALGHMAKAEIHLYGAEDADVSTDEIVRLRSLGSDTAIEVRRGSEGEMAAEFDARHRQRFGFAAEGELVIDSIAVTCSAAPERPPRPEDRVIPAEKITESRSRLFAGGAWHGASAEPRNRLAAGERRLGPAILFDETSTIIIEPGWQAEGLASGALLLTRITPLNKGPAGGQEKDPLRLELFNNLFMSIAEQMGATLEKTAASVNIKERLDFSCALFDAKGALIANAPHMPVHLGSMGDSVESVIAAAGETLREGDVYALNSPYGGGTHLPDITVVMPFYSEGGLFAFLAARGHHADIGGMTPGSMPPNSTAIDQEGVLIEAMRIAEGGRFLEAELRARLLAGPYPARNPDQNIADLKAQIAACRQGAEELRRAIKAHGAKTVAGFMGHVQDNAEEAVRRVIDRLEDGAYRSEMDDGTVIAVAIRVDRQTRSAVIDFTGTSEMRPNNFNAPSPVTRAAVLYVFRCLVDDDIPMNAGCLRPLRILLPPGSVLAPSYPAAVVAGNVETSQAVTDTLFAACGALAAAQGTMNNFTFGTERYQYYETISGGAGASRTADGASAVQTHMTNSRLTDPEILEWRFPVRLDEFSVRRGSGGQGRHKGGDGVIRRLTFLEPMTAGILSTRRRTEPFGICGGGPGLRGETRLIKRSGETLILPSSAECQVEAGDAIEIRTPGGGGFGREK